MARYIDADALLEDLNTVNPIYKGMIEWAKQIVEAQPTADVVERKKGEWNFEESPDGYYHAECSECGHWFYEDAFLKPYNYCPNCGANMRGE